jgi:hypothetical protein
MHSNTAEYREFVEFAASKYRALASQAPSPSWANDIKRLAQATGEVLMTASPLLQETDLFADLKLTHERILKLMAQHVGLIDGESSAGNRFEE